jgi:flavin-binding protein dodecin
LRGREQTLVTRAQWREDETVSIDEPRQGGVMSDSVYKVIEVIGTSSTSWEEAAKTAVDKVASHLEDVRVAEVVELDLRLEENKVMAYRAKVKVSFKYHDEG